VTQVMPRLSASSSRRGRRAPSNSFGESAFLQPESNQSRYSEREEHDPPDGKNGKISQRPQRLFFLDVTGVSLF